MLKKYFSVLALLLSIYNFCAAQDVPILSYSQNNFGQVQLEIEGRADQYYLLSGLHEPNLQYESITSITLGIDGTMFISEPLAAFPLQNYKITAHPIMNPVDSDGDGIDDISELKNMPALAPLNFAREVATEDGTTSINSPQVYSDLAVVSADIPWAPFLNNQEFVKFAIVNQFTEEPEIYFINSRTHEIHADFLFEIDVDQVTDNVVTGEIVYNPNEILPNGAIGSYAFNFSFGEAYSFRHTRRTFELLAANMPFLQNNLVHFIGNFGEQAYNINYKSDYEGSRLEVVLESEFFADVDYLPFNQAEGYGFFKLMALDENPGSRDIVIYDALPNSLPRVGGIITSVIQTPLSHVNLRAIQDNVPNAYIKNPLEIDSISNLLGKYIYYKVEQDGYELREASLDEVNDWYEKLRPTEAQIPDRDLTQTKILPLDEIGFEMSTSFGAKCSNVATMRRFGFPDNTIPNGFGIPFYFYDEFMKYNGFYEKAELMITDADFISDLETRIARLKAFRKEIKDADLPQWMLDELQAMHDSFPSGTSVRCRSSTNNEDLPGFSGAGLYTSKTQHPDEGHISKSVKQVYASMWNFRAYDERDFYRVDQYVAAMGILCHPNYEDEKSNGVGVSIDPIYQTEGNFYLNTQVGESLITNPDANSIPEEMLLNEESDQGYFVLRNSNLVPDGTLVMGEAYLDQMRTYLGVIHDEFEILYKVVGAEGFGMDIEYKVTKDDQLIIKQARPWVSFWADIKAAFDLAVVDISNPQSSSTLGASEFVTTEIANRGLNEMSDFSLSLLLENELIETIEISDTLRPQSSAEYQFTMPQDLSSLGDYNLATVVSHVADGYDRNDTFRTVLTKLYAVEGGIEAELAKVNCGEEIEANARITNYGANTFNRTEIEVVVNGVTVDTFVYFNSIPYQSEVNIVIPISENLKQVDNEIILNLIKLNGEDDPVSSNNSSSFVTSLDSEKDFVILEITADEFPDETSWGIYDINNNLFVAQGQLTGGDGFVREELCLNYNSCFNLILADAAGDGICCEFGFGNFILLSATGDTLVTNDGDFEFIVSEQFCLDWGILSQIELGSTSDFKLYPNPTEGEFTIEMNGSAEQASPVQIEIYTTLGRLIRSDSFSYSGGKFESRLDLSEQPAGSYVVRCFNGTSEEYYKVIKM